MFLCLQCCSYMSMLAPLLYLSERHISALEIQPPYNPHAELGTLVSFFLLNIFPGTTRAPGLASQI